MARTTSWTYDDFLRVPDDGRRHELLDGVHVSEATPATPHQQIATRLAASFFSQFGRDHYDGFFTSPIDVILADDSVLEPDLVYVRPSRMSIVQHAGVFGPPDLVIEILSPSTKERDLTVKRDIYGRYGVREYWIVDGTLRTVELFALADDREPIYGGARSYGTTDVVVSPSTGWRLVVADLFPAS